ncbi:MAG: type III-B CRISPR-associated protein Cas10/Cmr2 [Coriobacteriia bacterium]|nr:type III-B CRISPR-associated protein Cas10/Cmr2 [Coriobacteriia bacterium]
MSTRYVHFALGPVQSFVSQARRTRDFWAGSFLLSWLSAVAMNSAIHAGGRVAFPHPSDEFLSAVATGRTGPQQGLIPNRFICEIPSQCDPAQLARDVKVAWRALADRVWAADLDSALQPELRQVSRRLWDEQVSAFWECAWAVTADADAADVLDRRKNIRDTLPPAAEGIKCSLMDGWQELSCAPRPGAAEVVEFWNRVRTAGGALGSDVREGERLSAIAFVKRRFVRAFETLDETLPSGLRVRGWALPPGVPSVAYMAAVHWVADAIAAAEPRLLEEFVTAARAAAADSAFGVMSESSSRIQCVERACADAADQRAARAFASLDAAVFFDESQAPATGLVADAHAWRRLAEARGSIAAAAHLRAPEPYYALMAMDGDSVGALLGDTSTRAHVAEAMAEFSRQALEVVAAHNGFLIYAGGDDVLAMLSARDVLECASALRAAYVSAFRRAGGPAPATISAGVAFAHTRVPLTSVVAEAHRLLDAVAKERTGRDAIAVSVLKPGSTTVEWSQPWASALDEGGAVIVQALAGSLADDGEYTNSFLSRLGALIAMLQPPGTRTAALSPEEQERLVAADLAGSGAAHPGLGEVELLRRASTLLGQCRPRERAKIGDQWEITETGSLEVDGALLARFLASQGAGAR